MLLVWDKFSFHRGKNVPIRKLVTENRNSAKISQNGNYHKRPNPKIRFRPKETGSRLTCKGSHGLSSFLLPPQFKPLKLPFSWLLKEQQDISRFILTPVFHYLFIPSYEHYRFGIQLCNWIFTRILGTAARSKQVRTVVASRHRQRWRQ